MSKLWSFLKKAKMIVLTFKIINFRISSLSIRVTISHCFDIARFRKMSQNTLNSMIEKSILLILNEIHQINIVLIFVLIALKTNSMSVRCRRICNSSNCFSKAMMIALTFEIIYFRKSRHWAFESQSLVASLLFALKTHQISSQFHVEKKYFLWNVIAKLHWDFTRFLFCLKIALKQLTISLVFENWDKILHDFFFFWKLRCWWNITRFLFCLKIEIKYYTIFFLFENWNVDETLFDIFFVWKLRWNNWRFLSCLEIEMSMRHYSIFFLLENCVETIHDFSRVSIVENTR